MANKPEFGDDSLWRLAIQNYYPRIFNYVYFLTEDRYLAEDIIQETFAKGIEKFHQLKDPDKFFPWLLSIAINTGRTQIERNNRTVPASGMQFYNSKLSVDESLNVDARQAKADKVQIDKYKANLITFEDGSANLLWIKESERFGVRKAGKQRY